MSLNRSTQPDWNSSSDSPAAEPERILLVEDRNSLREMLSEFLQGKGYTVEGAGSIREAMDFFQKGYFHLLLVDLKLPDGSGLDLLKNIKQIRPTQAVVLMTAYGTIEDSVSAMRLGAVDFIQKPLDLNCLHSLIQRSITYARLQTEVLIYRDEFRRRYNLPMIISASPCMEALARQIQKTAATEATVLLTGESGTGKELFARAIHQLSPRRAGPFVEVNCAAIPETLIENELFGHVRGAYTGAESSTRGKFDLASGGTLLLDEIGEIPLGVQAKLLKALEEKKVTPIGGTLPMGVDVRIVAASNRDLEVEVTAGHFRSDLYYRLAQFPVRVPPLRERPADIVPLARYFLKEVASRMGKAAPEFAPEALAALQARRWPGNVRELKHLVERAVIVDEDGILDHQDFLVRGGDAMALSAGAIPQEELRRDGLAESIRRRMEDLEKATLAQVVQLYGDDQTVLAELLGITPKALSAKLRKYFIDKPRDGDPGAKTKSP